MAVSDNLVRESSSTTGTGNFTIADVTARQSFNAAFGTGGSDVFWYFITNQDADEWEVGTGSLLDAATLVRDTVIDSSNAGSLVNFSAGTKDVTSDVAYASQYHAGGTDVAVADGGTGASDAAGAKTNLGFITDVVDDTTPQLGGDLDANGSNIQFDDATGIEDDSGNEQLIFQKTASAVNHIESTNAATSNRPSIKAAGGDTNIDLELDGKGTGGVSVGAVAGNGQGTATAENGFYEAGSGSYTNNRVAMVLLSEGQQLSNTTAVDFSTLDDYDFDKYILDLYDWHCYSGTVGYGGIRTGDATAVDSSSNYWQTYSVVRNGSPSLTSIDSANNGSSVYVTGRRPPVGSNANPYGSFDHLEISTGEGANSSNATVLYQSAVWYFRDHGIGTGQFGNAQNQLDTIRVYAFGQNLQVHKYRLYGVY